MPREDRSFWADIFRKSPLIASFMALGGIIGLLLGLYFFVPMIQLRGMLRLVLLFCIGATLGGIFVGLILGVIVDSMRNAFREAKNKGKPPRDHSRRG